jgi:DNA-directed RNA polymerase subunit RPC12/RpoP
MKRLIDANALAKFIDYGHLNNPDEKLYSENDIREMIDMMPTIDAEPVRHGKWNIEISDDGHQATYRCSECGHRFKWVYDQHFPPVFNYCQKCGSRMDEE